MPDYYLFSRASITSDHITAHRARELYAEAQSEPEAGLYGDLDTGFYFWSIDTECGLKLVHYRVTPVPADEVPDDIRDHPSAQPAHP
jgi:hypothetical protein